MTVGRCVTASRDACDKKRAPHDERFQRTVEGGKGCKHVDFIEGGSGRELQNQSDPDCTSFSIEKSKDILPFPTGVDAEAKRQARRLFFRSGERVR